MPIVLDRSLCDSVPDCPAVRICDAEALRFDPVSGFILYDRQKCRDCGTCSNYCGMNAILHVPSEEEWLEVARLLHSQALASGQHEVH